MWHLPETEDENIPMGPPIYTWNSADGWWRCLLCNGASAQPTHITSRRHQNNYNSYRACPGAWRLPMAHPEPPPATSAPPPGIGPGPSSTASGSPTVLVASDPHTRLQSMEGVLEDIMNRIEALSLQLHQIDAKVDELLRETRSSPASSFANVTEGGSSGRMQG